MAIELMYKHQQKTYELMKQELKLTGKAAYIYPTGCGKSFPSLKYIDENPGKKALIIVPTIAIKHQFEDYIKQQVSQGKERLKAREIFIVTYQKVLTLGRSRIQPDVIICDEIHRWGAENWEIAVDNLLNRFSETELIGMTATPERTDKRNMAQEKFGSSIVYEMSLTEALSGEKEGEVILKTPRYIRVLSELKGDLQREKEQIKTIEDPIRREKLLQKYQRLEEIVNTAPGIEDVMEMGMKKKNGKYLIFCKDRRDMQDKMAKAQTIFGKVNPNIDMQYVLSKSGARDFFGKTQKDNRITIEHFKNKKETEDLKLLFCVDMLNEGLHIEGVDGEVLFDLTESKILYKQRIGRVLSADQKAGETVIIDPANNWLNQIETYQEIEHAIQKGQVSNGIRDSYNLLQLTPEETELLSILKEIKEKSQYHNTYQEIIEWLDAHEGNLPRGSISKDDKRVKTKEMTTEELSETNLRRRWNQSEEFRILKEYIGKDIIEVPEEYREKIETLRSYGLGQKEKTTYEQIIEWLEVHDGNLPKSVIARGGEVLRAERLTSEEKEEINLRNRWEKSTERKILNQYIGKDINEVPEEYQEKIKELRKYGLGRKEKTTYEQIIEWLEKHEGQMPSTSVRRNGKPIKRSEMTEEEREGLNLHIRWNRSKEKKVLEEYAGREIKEVPEEYQEKIKELRRYGLGRKEKTTYEQIIEWLETHEGKMPPVSIRRGGNHLRSDEMKEERNGLNLNIRWNRSKEKKVLDEYAGKDILEVPEEYRDKIEKLRSYGLGQEEKDMYEQMIEWLEVHSGDLPRNTSYRNGKRLSVKEMTEEERNEINLRARWNRSKEKKVLDEYAGKDLSEVPEEYQKKIEALRNYGLGQEEKDACEQVLEWLETHEGKMPRKHIGKNGKTLKREEMTEEEKEEINLQDRWRRSKERKILDEYVGKDLNEVPEEYQKKIEALRNYGLGQEEKETYEQIIEWLETHEGNLPKETAYHEGKRLKAEEMTEEKKKEVRLGQRWNNSKEREILNKYVGRDIQEVPKEYQEKIEKLRSYGLGQEEKTAYDDMVEWLETHEGKMPRNHIIKEGKELKRKEMTKEEKKEINLQDRWRKSQEKKILDEYAGRDISEVPEEYRDKIKTLRSYGQLGRKKDNKIKDRMKKTVGKHVGDNQEVREELEGLTKKKDENSIGEQ